MKGKRRMLQMLAGGFLVAALLAGPAQAAEPEIRVDSWKGSALEVGERSLLIIGPAGAEYEASSSNPEAVALERVLTYWVAVARAEGTTEITVTNAGGDAGSLTLTVGAAESSPASSETPELSANMEIRLELVRLINEVRRENGVPELTINMALMDAAQEHAARQYTSHHRKEECETAAAHGYPHGFGCNLTAFTGAGSAEIPQRAARNWRNSPGHFQTMIDPAYDAIGVGIATVDGWTYCYLFAGNPNSYNPYA